MQFRQPCQKFFARCPMISGKSLKIIVNLLIFRRKNSFASKCSSGDIECDFIHPAENFTPGDRKFFAENPKKFYKVAIFFEKKNLFLKMFLWTRRVEFCQICRNFFAIGPKCLLRVRKYVWNYIFSQKISSPLSKVFRENFENFC